MALEQPGTAEGLVADIALVFEVVRKHVHGQGGHADVDLAADFTLLG